MFEYRNQITFIKLHSIEDRVVWIRTDRIEVVEYDSDKGGSILHMIGGDVCFVKESVDEIMKAISGGDDEE